MLKDKKITAMAICQINDHLSRRAGEVIRQYGLLRRMLEAEQLSTARLDGLASEIEALKQGVRNLGRYNGWSGLTQDGETEQKKELVKAAAYAENMNTLLTAHERHILDILGSAIREILKK